MQTRHFPNALLNANTMTTVEVRLCIAFLRLGGAPTATCSLGAKTDDTVAAFAATATVNRPPSTPPLPLLATGCASSKGAVSSCRSFCRCPGAGWCYEGLLLESNQPRQTLARPQGSRSPATRTPNSSKLACWCKQTTREHIGAPEFPAQ